MQLPHLHVHSVSVYLLREFSTEQNQNFSTLISLIFSWWKADSNQTHEIDGASDGERCSGEREGRIGRQAEYIPVSVFLTGCSGKVKVSKSYTYLGEEEIARAKALR